jgi:hypothetical protein
MLVLNEIYVKILLNHLLGTQSVSPIKNGFDYRNFHIDKSVFLLYLSYQYFHIHI